MSEMNFWAKIASIALILLVAASLYTAVVLSATPTEATSNKEVHRNLARPSSCQGLIQNGSFEPDFTNWTTSGNPVVIDTVAYSGTYSARLGATDNADDTIYQEVTLPLTVTSASLTYWRYISSTEFGTPWDFLYVEARDAGGALLQTLETLNSSHASEIWEQSTIDLTAYPALLGQTFRLTFNGVTDGTDWTSFYIDLVEVEVCADDTCEPDAYEPNNSLAGAALVSLPLLTDTLRICPWDEDWFKFDMLEGYQLTIDIAFQHAVGDLDLHLYDFSGTLLDSSAGSGDTEQIIYDVTVVGTYFVRVFPYAPADGQIVPYSISIQESANFTPTPTPTNTPTPTSTSTRTPTPTSTPTRTPTPTPTSGLPRVDLQVLDMEVVQSIQNLNNDIPLIVSKRAYARIYVRTDGATVKDVRGHLEGQLDGVPLSPVQVACANKATANGTASLSTQRASTSYSLYCIVPANWLNTIGQLQLTGYAHSSSIDDPNANNNWDVVIQDLEESPPLHIQVVQVRDGGFLGIGAKGPSYKDFYKMHLVTQRMYPVNKVTLHPRHRLWVMWLGDHLTIVAIAGVDLLDRDPGPNTVHTGVVRNNKLTKWGGMGSPFRHTWVVVRPDIWDGFGTTVAHELGHGFGMFHINDGSAGWPFENYPYPVKWLSAGGERDHYGVDTGYSTPVIYLPQRAADLMSYQRLRWISPYTYNKLRATLRAGAGLPVQQLADIPIGPQPRSFSPDQETEYLMMVGLFYTETQAITLTPMMRLMGVDLDPEAQVNPDDGLYSVRLLDAGDNPLAEQYFGLLEGNHQETGGLIKLLVPYMTDTARIVIADGSTELLSYPVSANPPTVVLDPVIGPVSGPITATWTASDLDGDHVSATLLLSADGGGTWDPIAMGIGAEQAELDTSLWPGTAQGMLRILVTDGVNTGEDVTGPFEVTSKAPIAFVASPNDGAILPPYVPLFFSATGYDAEDGPLGDGNYSWSSNREGPLGDGEEILVPSLSLGWHEITVTATDSHANSGSDTISVYVGYRIYLPLVFGGYSD